ncbi:MAG: hypothetical protein VX546_13065 [Myxococcota bacterium]|nr:hypothetical protein [Myxococcota bacterium]
MKKVLIGVAAVFCIALAGVWIYVDEIVGGAIQRGGSAALGVDVQVDFVRISPLDGKLRLNGLDIANPPGFDSSRFLRIGSGAIVADLGTLEDDVVEVPRISMEDVDVSLDREKHRTNYGQILENVKQFEASDDTQRDDSQQRYVVRLVEIKNVTARVEWSKVAADKTALNVVIPEIEFRDLGAKDGRGVTMAEITGIFTKALLASIARYGVNLPGAVRDGLEVGLSGVGAVTGVVVKGAGTALVDVTSGVVGGIAGEEAGDKVRGAGSYAVGGVRDFVGGTTEKSEEAVKGVGDALGKAEGGVLGGLRHLTGTEKASDETP